MRSFTTRQKDELHATALTAELDIDNILEWIAKNCDPEDVFSEADLVKWARANDFVGQSESEDAAEVARTEGFNAGQESKP